MRHLRHRNGGLFALFLLLVAGVFGSHPLAAQGPGMPGTPPLPPMRNAIVHGSYIRPIYHNNTEVDAFDDLVGKDAGIVMAFYSWGFQLPDTLCGFVDMTYKHSPRPSPYDCGVNPTGPEIRDTTLMLTWEPNANPAAPYGCALMQNGRTNLQAVIDGACDNYIDEFARRVQRWNDANGDKFMMRLAHEMNIADQVWWHDNPNYPAQYVAFFRHVVDRFRAIGVTEEVAQFVWSPNYASNPVNAWNSMPNYYPGDAYVQWIGLSGYNWYGVNGQDPRWRTFSDIFNSPDAQLGGKSVLAYLHCAYAKPIVIAEIGTVEGPGGTQTKANWVADTYNNLTAYPFVKAIVWFNDYAFGRQNAADFRVTEGSAYSTPRKDHYPGWHHSLGAVTDVYRTALDHSYYLDHVPPLNKITPTGTYCGALPLGAELRTIPHAIVGRGQSVNIPLAGLRLQETPYTLRATGLPTDFAVSFNPTTVYASAPYATMRVTAPEDATLTTYPITIYGDSAVGTAESQQVLLEVVEESSEMYLPILLQKAIGPEDD